MVHSTSLSNLTGADVWLKLENFMPTGSFKERGALNRLLCLSEEERARGVIAASAGNHAQAVAFHGQRLGIKVTIIMPTNAPQVKISRTRGFGATVHLNGDGYDDAYLTARKLSEEQGQVYLHAYDDDHVIAGQGTLGLELLKQHPDTDVVIVPVGGGGLAGGIATAMKGLKREVSIVGVQSVQVPSMVKALELRRPIKVDAAKTLADGIAVRQAGVRCLDLFQRYVDQVVTVSEQEIVAAMKHLLTNERMVAEGAGAVAVAALLHGRTQDIKGKKVVAVVSGGNVDLNTLAQALQ